MTNRAVKSKGSSHRTIQVAFVCALKGSINGEVIKVPRKYRFVSSLFIYTRIQRTCFNFR